MEQIVELSLDCLERGFYQPREYFDALAMESTMRSIREKGQKYPVIVRPILPANPLYDPSWTQAHYELADGERRYRCCKELGFQLIKALVRDLSDEEMLDYTLTTNDSLPLNPIEKAQVFSRLAKEFGKSQAEIARSFNLKQQQVSEYVRLLDLPKEVQDLTARAVISVRHARELLKLTDEESIKNIAFQVEKKAITTRQLTKIVKNDDLKPENIDKSKKNSQEMIQMHDISFESASSSPKYQENGEHRALSAILLEENRPERQQIIRKSAPSNQFLAVFDQINLLIIPSKLHLRMEMWLGMELGSRDQPERWLSKVELSLLGGLGLALLVFFLPTALGLSILAVLGTLLVYLFVF